MESKFKKSELLPKNIFPESMFQLSVLLLLGKLGALTYVAGVIPHGKYCLSKVFTRLFKNIYIFMVIYGKIFKNRI